MDSNPYVLVLSSTNTKPKSLIKLITKSTTLGEETLGLIKHVWSIDTKYYTADITFIGSDKDFDRNEPLNNNVEGIIIHFDPNKESGLKDLKVWDKIENDCDPEVKLLIANYCNDETKITRTKAIEWCLKRGFEFIELYPSKTEIEEPVYQEKFGVDRIIEALHSHTWSNLDIKSHKENKLSNDEKLLVKQDEDIDADDYKEDLDEFSDLFSQLQNMRESLNSVPSSQRIQCAEQMVTAFWKAIGGEEEEISDL